MSSIKLQKNKILLTGKPGIGKTTIVKKIVEKFKDRAGGFYTEEIREKDRRVGFKIKNINGEEGILSHIDIKSNYNVGKYGVDVKEIDRIGVNSISHAIQSNHIDFIIIDEIAKMELSSRNFSNSVLSALNGDKIVIGVLQEKNIPFLNSIRNRKDVEIICITHQNRHNIPEDICNFLESRLARIH